MARVVFDDELFGSAGMDDVLRRKSQNMVRGGAAGQAGYDYQRDYALFLLLEHAAGAEVSPSFAVSEQASGGFVDDVVVDDGPRAIYCQIKRDAEITWTKRARELSICFEDQARLCRAAGCDFVLRLVVHEEHRARLLREDLPTTLKSLAEVCWFPDYEPRRRIWADPESVWFEPLCELSVRARSTNAREVIFAVCHNAMKDLVDVEGFVSVGALLDQVASLGYVSVRRPWVVEPPQWAQVRDAVAHVAGFALYLQEGSVHWEMCYPDESLEQGMIGAVDGAKWQTFAAKVLATQPQDIDMLWDILP